MVVVAGRPGPVKTTLAHAHGWMPMSGGGHTINHVLGEPICRLGRRREHLDQNLAPSEEDVPVSSRASLARKNVVVIAQTFQPGFNRASP